MWRVRLRNTLIPKLLATALLVSAAGSAGAPQAVPNRPPLQPGVFTPLPLGAVKPLGWLRQQLRQQAAGLSGHLDEFWPPLAKDSGWLGGAGESWERGPYYADGLVPLAYLLDDAALISKANKCVGWTLENQHASGWIGPAKNRDWWPNMVMLKALTQYQEASGDARVIPLMERYFRHQLEEMPRRPLERWAIYRWQDEVLSVLWLYNRTGDRKLLDLARLLEQQGFDWQAHFDPFRYCRKLAKSETSLATHVVNNAMALKAPAVQWLVSGEAAAREALDRQFREMDRCHLLPNGAHSGDEHYAGLDPTQGTELCAIVEAVFSLVHVIAATGGAAFADRLEKLAYNPLPGTFTGDMWAHQYDQQANQVLSSIHPRAWTTNGPESNLFGLEPNFGCCTANMHQGWPKFAANLWMAAPGGGLAAVAYGPSQVSAAVRGGATAILRAETAYPFRDRIRFSVRSPAKATFPLHFRIPAWAEGATLTINGKKSPGVKAGTFHCVERAWAPGDRMELTLPMGPRVTRWHHGSIAIERGPLVYSLKIGEDWRKIRDKAPAADWEVYPTTPWNYALRINEARPDRSVEVIEKPLGAMPFSARGAPVELRVKGRRLPEWKLENGSAGPLPESPVESAQPLETLTLIPYGSAKLRITAFPWLKK